MLTGALQIPMRLLKPVHTWFEDFDFAGQLLALQQIPPQILRTRALLLLALLEARLCLAELVQLVALFQNDLVNLHKKLHALLVLALLQATLQALRNLLLHRLGTLLHLRDLALQGASHLRESFLDAVSKRLLARLRVRAQILSDPIQIHVKLIPKGVDLVRQHTLVPGGVIHNFGELLLRGVQVPLQSRDLPPDRFQLVLHCASELNQCSRTHRCSFPDGCNLAGQGGLPLLPCSHRIRQPSRIGEDCRICIRNACRQWSDALPSHAVADNCTACRCAGSGCCHGHGRAPGARALRRTEEA
mmetsp:Transcript_83514/g.217476  ORF Transcript_83514/g.217476 Transcript_83514/m.217476 type:complete len:302 (-) Transcript_83514:7-912(-)